MMNNNNVETYIHLVEETIGKHLDKGLISKTIKNASKYSIEAGGKRFRPYLLFSTLCALNGNLDKGIKSAAAIEMIHTYSLIHDDLPAMDDDELRRGIPTNHIVFGEGVAILAGDNLLTESFNLLSNDTLLPVETRLKIVQILSQCAGQNGMIGGQMLDIEAEQKAIELTELENVHRYKTGQLIIAPVQIACIIEQAGKKVEDTLIQFAEKLGIIFQIRDDILDVIGDVKLTGKNTGSDVRKDKTTYVSALGLNGAKTQLNDMQKEAEMLLQTVRDDIDITSLKNVLNRFAIREQ